VAQTTETGGAPDENPLIQWLTRLLDWSAAAVLFGLMMLTFADVVAREIFNAPFALTTDLTRLMLAAVVYAVLPVISRLEQHVEVDLLDRFVPDRLVRPRQCVMNFCAAVIMALMAWQIWIQAQDKIRYNELTQFVEWPLAPIYFFMSVMCGLAALGLLATAYLYLVGKAQPRGADEGPRFE